MRYARHMVGSSQLYVRNENIEAVCAGLGTVIGSCGHDWNEDVSHRKPVGDSQRCRMAHTGMARRQAPPHQPTSPTQF